MKIARIFSLLLVLPLSAANFIDNPNFDDDTKGWSYPCMTIFCRWDGKIRELKPYKEHTRQGIISDQYAEIFKNNYFYVMNGVSNGVPLYFAVEIGTDSQSQVSFEIKLTELYKRTAKNGRSCDGNFNTADRNDMAVLTECRGMPASGLLAVKNLTVQGNDIWHWISSDYPAYTKKIDSEVQLSISVLGQANIFQINYAQVGTDPKALGGRGARKKNFNARDEL